jgi:uncharacterized membrane protein
MLMPHRAGTSSPGLRLYGLAAVVLGAIQLLSGDFATIWHPVRPGVPFRSALVYVTGVSWIVGGAAVQWPRAARAGLTVLGVLFLLAACLWLPRVIGFPRLFGTWLGFAEELAPAVAAMIACVTAAPAVAPAAAPSRARAASPGSAAAARASLVGYVLFGSAVVTLGLAHFFALEQTASMVPGWIPLGRRFWAMATGLAMLLAGLAILTRIRAVLAARLLAVLMGTFATFVWLPRLYAHPSAPRAWGGTAITLAVAGAAWVVADALRGRGAAADGGRHA